MKIIKFDLRKKHQTLEETYFGGKFLFNKKMSDSFQIFEFIFHKTPFENDSKI